MTISIEGLSPTTQAILREMLDGCEGEAVIDGKTYASVYRHNFVPDGMSPHAFAGHLGALAKAGLYRPNEDDDPDVRHDWGWILIEAEPKA